MKNKREIENGVYLKHKKVIIILIILLLTIISMIFLNKNNILGKLQQQIIEKYTIEQVQTKLENAIENLKIEQEEKGYTFGKEDLLKLNNEEIDVGSIENFPIEVICEKYKFNVDENYRVTYVEEAHGTIITYSTEVDENGKGYTNKDEVNILIKTVNEKGIKTIEYPDGSKLKCNGKMKVGIDYTVNRNGKYTFIVIDNEDNEVRKDIAIDKIDKKEPVEFTPTVEVNRSSIIITENGEDAERDEENVKSEIDYYEYYLIDKDNNTHKYETNKISGLSGKYQVYIIAYDRAGNKRVSNIVEITVEIEIFEVKAGSFWTMAIDSRGSLWSWGYNYNGQLGNGTTNSSSKPTQIKNEINFKKIAGGDSWNLAIDQEGNLWSWGLNGKGQLGNGTTKDSTVPVQIKEGIKFKEIVADTLHSLAIDEEGNLWSWGVNDHGELGNGTTTDSIVPIPIKEDVKFREIATGWHRSLAIDEEGNLWSWGSNSKGVIGNGTISSYIIEPTQIKEGVKFKGIASKGTHSLAIDEEGNLWSWGVNENGRLGNGTTKDSTVPIQIKEGTKFKKIATGAAHSLAIDEEGNLWSWGKNNFGQLGNGTTKDSVVPIQIKEGTKFKEINAGSTHSLAVDEEGNLWLWGRNNYGQLGDESTTDSYEPIQINLIEE